MALFLNSTIHRTWSSVIQARQELSLLHWTGLEPNLNAALDKGLNPAVSS
jgi:hypothetical protein